MKFIIASIGFIVNIFGIYAIEKSFMQCILMMLVGSILMIPYYNEWKCEYYEV